MSYAPEDLRTYIIGSTAVSDLISTRCHYTMIPGASAKPHVWFRFSRDDEELTMDGVGGLHQVEVDLECLGASPSSVQAVADAVKARCHGHKGTMGNITCAALFVEDKDDDYVPWSNQSDEGAHVVAFNLRLWYTT